MNLLQILAYLQRGSCTSVMEAQLMSDATDLELLGALLPPEFMKFDKARGYFDNNAKNIDRVIKEIRRRIGGSEPTRHTIWVSRLMAIFKPVVPVLGMLRHERRNALKALIVFKDLGAYEYLLDFQEHYLHHKHAGHDKTLLDIVQAISGDHSLEAYEEAIRKPGIWRLFLDSPEEWIELIGQLNLEAPL